MILELMGAIGALAGALIVLHWIAPRIKDSVTATAMEAVRTGLASLYVQLADQLAQACKLDRAALEADLLGAQDARLTRINTVIQQRTDTTLADAEQRLATNLEQRLQQALDDFRAAVIAEVHAVAGPQMEGVTADIPGAPDDEAHRPKTRRPRTLWNS